MCSLCWNAEKICRYFEQLNKYHAMSWATMWFPTPFLQNDGFALLKMQKYNHPQFIMFDSRGEFKTLWLWNIFTFKKLYRLFPCIKVIRWEYWFLRVSDSDQCLENFLHCRPFMNHCHAGLGSVINSLSVFSNSHCQRLQGTKDRWHERLEITFLTITHFLLFWTNNKERWKPVPRANRGSCFSICNVSQKSIWMKFDQNKLWYSLPNLRHKVLPCVAMRFWFLLTLKEAF